MCVWYIFYVKFYISIFFNHLQQNFSESDFQVNLASQFRFGEILADIKRNRGGQRSWRKLRVIQWYSCKGPYESYRLMFSLCKWRIPQDWQWPQPQRASTVQSHLQAPTKSALTVPRSLHLTTKTRSANQGQVVSLLKGQTKPSSSAKNVCSEGKVPTSFSFCHASFFLIAKIVHLLYGKLRKN